MEIPRRSKTVNVLERKRSERVDSAIDDPEIDPASARRLGMQTALYVPLLLRDEAIGVITARDKNGPDPRFTDEDLRIAEVFGQRASVAVELSRLVQRDALQRVVTAQEAERRRLARELHDETGQALTSILLGLRSVEDAPDGAERAAAVEQLRCLVRATLQVASLSQLARVLARLEQLKDVLSVSRDQGWPARLLPKLFPAKAELAEGLWDVQPFGRGLGAAHGSSTTAKVLGEELELTGAAIARYAVPSTSPTSKIATAFG